MPELRRARAPLDEQEARQIRKLAGHRHAPGDGIARARMIVGSWEGQRTTIIADAVGGHPQTVRERLGRFNAAGRDGRGDHAGAGRTPLLTEQERGAIIALARSTPPGRLARMGDGLQAFEPDQAAQWRLDALARAAHERGIKVDRSQIRRLLLQEGVRWRHPHSWAASTDPESVPKGRGTSPPIPTRRRGRRSSASTSPAQ